MAEFDYLNDTDYFRHYNPDVLETITNLVVPRISQFEYFSQRNFLEQIVYTLMETEYSYEDIYYSIGVYLLSQSDDIEEDMNIVRPFLYTIQRSESNVVNQVINLMNLMLPREEPLPDEEKMIDVPLIISKDILENLKEVSFKDLETTEKTCSICLDDYEPESKLRRIPCEHLFHTKCLDKWLTENSYKCPLCRVGVATHKSG